MIKALQLIFSPAKTWEKIVVSNRGVAATTILFLLPLIAVASVIEGYSLLRFGERGDFGVIRILPKMAMRYEATQFIGGIIVMILGAKFLHAVAVSFHVPCTIGQCFTTVAYGFSPMYLGQALHGVPVINAWICWTIGAILSISALYHGVALALKPDQTKGFGLYLTTIVFVLLLSGFSHFVAISVLHEKLLTTFFESAGL